MTRWSAIAAMVVAASVGVGPAVAAPSVAALQRRIADLEQQREFYAVRAERYYIDRRVARGALRASRSRVAALSETVFELRNLLYNATRPETVTVTAPATCPLPPRTAAEAYAQIRSLYGLFPTRGPYSASLYRSGSYESYSFTYAP